MKSDKFIINRDDFDEIFEEMNKYIHIVYQYRIEEHKIIILVTERFYLRANGTLTATIIIEHINENRYQITVVVAGKGPALTTLGAESSMIKKIKTYFLAGKQKC